MLRERREVREKRNHSLKISRPSGASSMLPLGKDIPRKLNNGPGDM